jgi:hypothetical protein
MSLVLEAPLSALYPVLLAFKLMRQEGEHGLVRIPSVVSHKDPVQSLGAGAPRRRLTT